MRMRFHERPLFFALFLAALSFPAVASAQVTIEKIDGVAEVYSAKTQTWSDAKTPPQRLVDGDRVRSAPASSVSLTLPDGSRILLGSSSEFVVDSGKKSDILLGLSLGSLKSWVSKFSARHSFRVRTPTAVCAVRGTQFIVDVDAAHATSVDVSEGVVSVRTLLGEEVELGDNRLMRSIRVLPDRPLDLPGTGAPGGTTPKSPRTKLASALKPAREPARAPERVQLSAREEFRNEARNEVSLSLRRERVQASAAYQTRMEQYQEGKVLIDVNGQLTRLQEYILRPTPNSFQLVALNSSKANGLNSFTYTAQFNQALPVDLRLATQYINGSPGSIAPPYYIVSYQTVRSNGIDSIQEFGTGGHLVSSTLTGQQLFYNPVQDTFTSAPKGSEFWQTLFDNYSYRVDGAEMYGWQPVSGSGITSYNYGAGGINTRILGGGAMCGSVSCATAGPVTCTSLTCENAARPSTTGTPGGPSLLTDQATITYAATGAQEIDTYYVIGNNGSIATTAAFGGLTSGQQYENELLNFNYEQIISETAFQGRTINLTVEPKILFDAGLQ